MSIIIKVFIIYQEQFNLAEQKYLIEFTEKKLKLI